MEDILGIDEGLSARYQEENQNLPFDPIIRFPSTWILIRPMIASALIFITILSWADLLQEYLMLKQPLLEEQAGPGDELIVHTTRINQRLKFSLIITIITIVIIVIMYHSG